MFKKSQVTIFIVIGVVLVAVIGFLYMGSTTKSIEPEFDANAEIIPLKTYVESCLKRVLEEGVDLLSVQGGCYYNIPESCGY